MCCSTHAVMRRWYALVPVRCPMPVLSLLASHRGQLQLCEQLNNVYTERSTCRPLLSCAVRMLGLLPIPRILSVSDKLLAAVDALVGAIAAHDPAGHTLFLDDAVALLQVRATRFLL